MAIKIEQIYGIFEKDEEAENRKITITADCNKYGESLKLETEDIAILVSLEDIERIVERARKGTKKCKK